MKYRILFVLFIFVNPTFSAYAKDLVFALVPKNTTNSFYQKSHDGCITAAKKINVKCIFVGPKKSDVRLQNIIIEQLIDANVDGIAVAVTQSSFLATGSIIKAIKAGIPIITFDSDFDSAIQQKIPNIRLAYVGSNNYALGQALGYELKKLRPRGGNLVLQMGRPNSPNIEKRLEGFRSVFQDNLDNQQLTVLRNANSWNELRTPYKSFGSFKRARAQMNGALSNKKYKLDAFVALGGWSQFDVLPYTNMITPHLNNVKNKNLAIIMADTEDSQLSLLKQGLSHGNIGQRPYQMGEKAILILNAIVNKEPFKEFNYTNFTYCNQINYETCTEVEKIID